MRNIVLASAFALILAALPAQAGGWPAGARLTILGPANGATVSGPVTVVMGLAGLGVAPAGVDRPDTGHHHILVDAPAPEGAVLEESMPADDHVKHFGGGQTQTDLKLAPGMHTLQLIFGDQNHIPHNPPLLSEKITVTVQ